MKIELPLTELKNGETGVITSTDLNSERRQPGRHRARRGWGRSFMHARFGKRITDMGLTPGTEITVVKSAPFNGPVEVCVRCSRLAIGREMASRIFVQVER